MKDPWSRRNLKCCPELTLFETEAEASEALDACWKRIPRKWLYQMSLSLFGLIAGGPFVLILIVLGRFKWIPDKYSFILLCFLTMGVSGFVGAMVFGFVWERVWQPLLRRWLRQELIARGIPVCIACGYDLRGQTEPRCPECGGPFRR